MTYIPEGLSTSLSYPQRPSRHLYRRGVKRALDIGLILLALPLLLPLGLICALLAARDGGPVFYAQMRVGEGGTPFRLWKFRTMVGDADAALAAHLAQNPAARSEWAFKHKLTDDPRITPWGTFLRRTSLDELPQLLNVLRGEMSLVGPRPITVEEEAEYTGSAYRNLRPGLTGPWQVSARNQTGFQARASYDDAYGRQLSLITDLVLLVKTCGVVLRRTGL